MVRVCKKLRGCKTRLKEWHRQNFGELNLQIAIAKDQLLEVQKQMDQGVDEESRAKEDLLQRKLEDLWQKEAMYWHQRSRIKWLKMGDRNSRFFHLTTIQRRQRNQIVRLKNVDGEWKSEIKEIATIVRDYFQSLYSAPPLSDAEDILSLVEPVITPEMNASLTRNVGREEVRLAVFQQEPLKAPGSDGFPGIFYQQYWDIVGNDVFEAVRYFFLEGKILNEMNHTNITLIPKMGCPELINHFRPISLCRFIYKIISKVLVNRLQPFMDRIISEQQSAFIPGRQIQDNIIVAHEVFHYLKHKKKGNKVSVAVKLDLNKAYDRVSWDFLIKLLQKMGFEDKMDKLDSAMCFHGQVLD